jgi:CHAD domain-containing protein
MSLTALAVLDSTDTLSWAGEDAPSDAEAIASVFATAFDGAYTVEPHGTQSMNLVHLDTVDSRVQRAGWHVVYCPAQATLVAVAPDEPPVEQVVGKTRFPAELHTLPDGPVRSLLARAVWVRALVPYASTKVSGRTFSVLNADAKTVARVTWWSSSLAGSQSLPPRVHVASLRGYAADAKKATKLLRADDAVRRARQTWFAELPAAPAPLGGEPATRTEMTPDQPAAPAVAAALLGFLDELEANVAGALDDVDTEFLHDLRVAVRRTRSILKLLGDALPDGKAARVIPEFRWLGQITTPTRDLDVYLLGVDDMAASITSPNDLVPFAAHLRRRRNAVRRELVRQLRSQRFAELRTSWRADLEGVLAGDPGPGTAAKLANDRLHRTFRTVRKRAAAISAESPAEDIHTLRKKCKELRYLLEVFAPILDRRAYKQVIGDFKELQQVLGEFQDGEVQALALRTFAQEMIDQGNAPAAALLAMGDLAARFDERQRHARSELTAHHDEYLGKRAAQHVDRLFAS